MKLLVVYVYYRFLELSRQPTYVVTTLLFPSMFFWFFAVPNATEPLRAQMLMASFSAFAVLGVVLFQFAVTLAQDRVSPWFHYLRTLPVNPWIALAAQLLASIVFSALAVGAVVAVAHLTCEVNLPVGRWPQFLLTVFAGGLPFASLGMLIGMLCSPKTAIPVANLIYLPLSFAGGLWLPPNALPKVIQDISEYLPTRMYAEIVWAGALDEPLKRFNVWGLGIYLVVFLLASMMYYRFDEGQRYT